MDTDYIVAMGCKNCYYLTQCNNCIIPCRSMRQLSNLLYLIKKVNFVLHRKWCTVGSWLSQLIGTCGGSDNQKIG